MLARLGLPRAARFATAAPLSRTVQPTLAPRSAHSSFLPLRRQIHLSRRLLRPTTISGWNGLPTSHVIHYFQAERAYSKLQEKLRPELFSGQGEREKWAKEWRARVTLTYWSFLHAADRAQFLLEKVWGITIDWNDVTPARYPELYAESCKIQAALESATSEDDIVKIRFGPIDVDIDDTDAAIQTAFFIRVDSIPDDQEPLRAYDLIVRRLYLKFAEYECSAWAPGRKVQLLTFWDHEEV
ncbi:hypothetical protein JCM1840_006669 [Sporobolomyces johnsonii]